MSRRLRFNLASLAIAGTSVGLLCTALEPVQAHAMAAQTLAAASCSASAVQQALDAASDGDTVLVPAGTCDWGSTTVSRDAGIHLRGAGRDQTLIRRSGADDGSHALQFDCSNGQPVEVSDIAFEGRQNASIFDNGLHLANGCRDFRIHDTRFTHFNGSGIEVRGSDARGVIYDSEFIDNWTGDSGEGYGVVVYGSSDWPDLDLGGPQAVFIEDNYFRSNRHSVASNYGSRYVVRHNTFVTTNQSRNTSMIDAHGRQSGSDRGSRSWEIYQNHLIFDDDGFQADGISIRGGDGVIFGNLIDHTHQGLIAYTAQFVIEAGCPAAGGQGSAGAYPVADQTRQAWVWDNTRTDTEGQFIRVSSPNSFDCSYYLKEGRDYFQTMKPGYSQYIYPHPLRGSDDTIFHNGFE